MIQFSIFFFFFYIFVNILLVHTKKKYHNLYESTIFFNSLLQNFGSIFSNASFNAIYDFTVCSYIVSKITYCASNAIYLTYQNLTYLS